MTSTADTSRGAGTFPGRRGDCMRKVRSYWQPRCVTIPRYREAPGTGRGSVGKGDGRQAMRAGMVQIWPLERKCENWIDEGYTVRRRKGQEARGQLVALHADGGWTPREKRLNAASTFRGGSKAASNPSLTCPSSSLPPASFPRGTHSLVSAPHSFSACWRVSCR